MGLFYCILTWSCTRHNVREGKTHTHSSFSKSTIKASLMHSSALFMGNVMMNCLVFFSIPLHLHALKLRSSHAHAAVKRKMASQGYALKVTVLSCPIIQNPHHDAGGPISSHGNLVNYPHGALHIALSVLITADFSLSFGSGAKHKPHSLTWAKSSIWTSYWLPLFWGCRVHTTLPCGITSIFFSFFPDWVAS